MKKQVLLVIVILLSINVSFVSASTWWNADKTRELRPRSYSYGDGFIIANISNEGVYGITYDVEQQRDDGGYSLIRHYFVASNVLGGWVDNGGGFVPLYYSYQKDVLIEYSDFPFFIDIGYELSYMTAADVNEGGIVDIDDFICVRDEWLNIKHCPHNTDVDKNGETERRDLDIVAFLWWKRAKPDKILLGMMKEIYNINFEQIVSEGFMAAPPKTGRPPEIFSLEEILSRMGNIPAFSYNYNPSGTSTSWGEIKSAQ